MKKKSRRIQVSFPPISSSIQRTYVHLLPPIFLNSSRSRPRIGIAVGMPGESSCCFDTKTIVTGNTQARTHARSRQKRKIRSRSVARTRLKRAYVHVALHRSQLRRTVADRSSYFAGTSAETRQARAYGGGGRRKKREKEAACTGVTQKRTRGSIRKREHIRVDLNEFL